MAESTQERHQVIRTFVAFGLLYALIHAADSGDYLSAATRPAVVWLLNVAGVTAANQGTHLLAGKLTMPWTRDCAGLNIFALLLALALWLNRREAGVWRYILRAIVAVPAAFVANVCRILTVVAIRLVSYPVVESPALHYFIGFLWLVPVFPLVVPRQGRNPAPYLAEMLYWITALSVLSPFVPAPGGTTVALCSLLLLGPSRYRPLEGRHFYPLMAAWALGGIAIGAAAMESLWIAWLVLFPVFAPKAALSSPAGWLLVAGSIPVVAMLPGAPWIVLAAAAWFVACWLRKPAVAAPAKPGPAANTFKPLLAGLLVLLPFVSALLSTLPGKAEPPPRGMMCEPLAGNAYRLLLVGQMPDIDVVWYSPFGRERHHTLAVCMQYRGIQLTAAQGVPDVLKSGQAWMCEYFIHRGRLVRNYRDYLRSSLLPFSSPGVHLILSAPSDSMTADRFKRLCDGLATQIEELATK